LRPAVELESPGHAQHGRIQSSFHDRSVSFVCSHSYTIEVPYPGTIPRRCLSYLGNAAKLHLDEAFQEPTSDPKAPTSIMTRTEDEYDGHLNQVHRFKQAHELSFFPSLRPLRVRSPMLQEDLELHSKTKASPASSRQREIVSKSACSGPALVGNATGAGGAASHTPSSSENFCFPLATITCEQHEGQEPRKVDPAVCAA
jgi:hypothetical protein